ncbi:Gag-Pol polyprotein [Phytophthora citrophthora]|uniref:Gag-Pol polyprotein n=1 Tax=Phytophthora citrophthora TaxID=4793 RepID=A0AAD9LJ18_9STRA|nr:Gag-Pol polyprotein [Phytophthora citrophthora]
MRTRSGRSIQGNARMQVDQAAGVTNPDASRTMTDTDFTTVIPVTSSALMPPYLTDVSHQALVKWKRERQEYEDAVEARCATTGEDRTKALISVKNSLNRQLLETLCKFEWNTTIEDVTEARIVAEIDKIVSNVMNDAIIDVDSIFKTELKMDMRERDVKARVIKYFMKCDEVIMQHGLAGTFSTIAGIKEKCKILKRHLEPAALRDAIDTHHRLVDPSSKTDETKLYSLVKEKALEQEKVFHLLSKRNRQQPRRTDDGTRTMRNSEKPPKPSNNQGFAAERHNEAKSNRLVVKSSATKKSQPSAESKPRTGCFHCGKDHWLSQCPDLDEVAKEALLAERKSKKGASGNGPKRYRTKRLEQSTVPVSDGRTTVLLNDTVEVPCCADSGCDLNIISRKHVELLQAQDSTVELIELDEPVHSQAVGGTTLISTHAIDNATPYRCKVRQYSPDKSAFLEAFNKRLVELGWVFENRESRWCCPALPVRKPSTNEFRQTTDYRPINGMTEPIAGVMPSLEIALEHCKDLISRWGGKQQPAARIHSAKRFTRSKRKHAESVAMTKNDMTPLRPLDQNGFVWPTTDEIGSIQALHVTPKGAVPGNDDLWRVNGLIWIPSDATELIERLLIIAHCGHNGHRGMNVMTNHIRRLFSIGGLSRMVCDFCEKCLLCLHVKGGVVIPRPFSETHHTYERNHTLHWDFLTLGESFGTSRYVLVLKDEATHFAELVECDGPTSEVAATSILDWYSRFGPPSVWVSDSGSHFKSKVISELGRRLKSRLEFILAYTPWKNGSVERVNRDITQVLKALALEFKVSMHDWPYLLPLVQSSINHSPVASLANRAPIELFTGLPCPNALDSIFLPGGKGRVATLDQPRPSTEQQLAKLRADLQEMHKPVKAERKRQAERYRARYHYHQRVNFSIGDYVLRSRVDEKPHANKLRVMWVGPYKVVGSADYYFTVEHLVNGTTVNVHPSRLKLYADDSLNVTEELLDHIASQGTLMAVESILEHRMNPDMEAYEIKVKWMGLETIEDSWEPLKTNARTELQAFPVQLHMMYESFEILQAFPSRAAMGILSPTSDTCSSQLSGVGSHINKCIQVSSNSTIWLADIRIFRF